MTARSLLIRCYPALWRDRYGDEFEAVLGARPLGPFDVADILLGAVDAQLRLRGRGAHLAHGRELSMSLRIGGIAAIVGAALLTIAGVLGSGLLLVNGAIPGLLLVAGLAVLLVAVAGLSAFQARVHPGLIWLAFAVTAIGTVGSVAGLAGNVLTGDPFWGVWFLGSMTALAGSALFAIATYRTAVLSRAAAALLGVGSGLPFFTVATNSAPLLPAAIICFLLGWFALGVQAIRLDRPAARAQSPMHW
jgi:hypothetical protein